MSAVGSIEDEPLTKQPPTILVVDDVVLVRILAARQLRDAGFAVIEAGSADEAMRILDASVEVDLVFADVHLQGSSLDGFALARWIRDSKPGIKVLLTSGVVHSPGPDETVLRKPYKHEELVRRIRTLLGLDRL